MQENDDAKEQEFLAVEPIQKINFREFEKRVPPDNTRKTNLYQNRKRPTKEIKLNIPSKTSTFVTTIEKSVDTKNYKIFQDYESKQEFFEIAKKNKTGNMRNKTKKNSKCKDNDDYEFSVNDEK